MSTPRTNQAIVPFTTEGKKYVNASFCRKLERELEEARTALKVIHTWATFRDGSELIPDHVAALCRRKLQATEPKS